MALVYGQRRTGKTFLLQERFRSEPSALLFIADESGTAEQVARFATEAEARFPWCRPLESIATWGGVLTALCQQAALLDERVVIVFDEAQYILGAEPAFASILQRLYDQLRHRARLHFLLCGSALGTLARLGDEGQPLYGRFDLRIELERFGFRDAALFAPDWSPVEAMRLYGVLGGLARHLAELRPEADLGANIVRAILSPLGALHDAPLDLLRTEHISSHADAQALLTAISLGENQFGNIAARSSLTASRTDFVLKELIALKIVDRIVRFGDRPGARYVRYRCADPMTNFWFRLARPARSYATQAGVQAAYDDRIAPRLPDLMGPIFERIVEQAVLAGVLGLSPSALAPYWSRNGDTEIDLVADSSEQRCFIECKWRPDAQLDIADLNQLRAHVGRSGLQGTAPTRLALATAGTFSKPLRTVAKAEGVLLLDAPALLGR